MKYLYIWLIIINIITFAVFGIDKKKAIDGKFRISELTLFVFVASRRISRRIYCNAYLSSQNEEMVL